MHLQREFCALDKDKFYVVLTKLILPLFTGSVLMGEEESNARESEIAIGKQNSLLIKPNKSADYRFIIKRGRAFQPFEISLLKNILKELSQINESAFLDPTYELTLQEKAVEKAVCDSVAPSASSVMLGLISALTKWSHRTYEGKAVDFGIILNLSENEDEKKLHYSNIVSTDFFALLSDGKYSFVEFNKDGYLMGYVSLEKINSYSTTAPNTYNRVARYCNDRKVGMVLTDSGDLLIFKNRTLMFAKRRGKWNIYSHEEVIQLLSYRTTHSLREVRRAVYLTSLDCSFKYSGGIIVYLKRDMVEQALTHINANDIVEEKYYNLKKVQQLEDADKLFNLNNAEEIRQLYSDNFENYLSKNCCFKSMCLNQMIQGRKFHELSRKFRQEIVAMDGATIIDFDGSIIAAGAILKIEAGSISGGGRKAAAMELSKYGIAIKISQDGEFQGFVNDKKHPKLLFTVN